jgi:hypothetical protein
MDISSVQRFTGPCRSTSRQIQAWLWLNGPKYVAGNDECMVCPYFQLWRRNNKEKDFKIVLGRHTRKYTHFTPIRLLFLTSPSRSNLVTKQPMCSGHRVCRQTSAESKSLNSRRWTSWKEIAHACILKARDEKRMRQFGCTYIRINLSDSSMNYLFSHGWGPVFEYQPTQTDNRSRDSWVSIATGHGLDGRRSITNRRKKIFSIPHRPDWFWGPPSLLSIGNRWSCTSIPSYVFKGWCLIN